MPGKGNGAVNCSVDVSETQVEPRTDDPSQNASVLPIRWRSWENFFGGMWKSSGSIVYWRKLGKPRRFLFLSIA